MDPILKIQAILAVLFLLVDSSTPLPHVIIQARPDVSGSIRYIVNGQPQIPILGTDVSSTASLSSLVQKAKLNVWKLGTTLDSTSTGAFKPSWASPGQRTQSLKTDLGCFACRMIAKTAHLVIRSGATEDEVARWGTAICSKFKFGTDRECHGLCQLMKKEVVYVFSQTSIDPTGTCSSILDQDCGASIDHQWTVTLPEVPKPSVEPVPYPKPNEKKLRVLHLTDVHLDPEYVVGTNADCGEMLCCRDENGGGSGNTSLRPAGQFGTYRGCDTPPSTLESLLEHAAATHKIDYVMWTGDDSPHDDWNQTTDSQLRILDKMGELFKKYFPSTPVFAAVGNHEGNPVNSFPPPSVASVASMDWLYGPLNRTWSKWFPNGSQPTTSVTILRGGFYSFLVFPGFRIISINMNYCNNLNWWLLLNATDPLNQLHWLAEELQAAESRNEKVHIIGHIPPGSFDCFTTWSANYYRIINRYEGTVRGQFFGHTHVDDFEVFYDVPDNASVVGDGSPRPTNVAYIAPSVTPYDGANPAYRIYTIDGSHSNSTWAVVDHETYFVNLKEANLAKELKWFRLYNAKDAYRMDSLQPADWNKLIDNLEKDDWLFQLFYRNYHRGSDVYPKCVTAECRRSLICNMKTARSGNHDLCKPTAKPTR